MFSLKISALRLASNSLLAILLQQSFSLQQFPLSQKTTHPKASLCPKASCLSSVSLLYPVVNKEVEQQFWGGA
jgi:hypothetical protein